MSDKDEEIHIKPFILLKDIDMETIKEDVNIMNKEFEKRYMGKFIIKENRRIDEAFKSFKGECRSYIIDNYCPHDIDKNLEDIDIDTYQFSDDNIEKGCRGITCEECWDKEL